MTRKEAVQVLKNLIDLVVDPNSDCNKFCMKITNWVEDDVQQAPLEWEEE